MRKWLTDRLDEIEKSKAGLARALGLPPARVHEMVRNDRDIHADEIAPMAAYLEWTEEYLLERITNRRASKLNFRPVPIVGYIGAGATILPIDDFPKGQGLDDIPCPVGMNPDRTVAAIVRGSSMEPLIPDGWRVFYSRDPEQDAAGVVGKLCVVKLSDGPTMLKQVRRGHSPGRFNLISTNAALLEDQALDWASPVRAMQAPDNDAATDDGRPAVPIRRTKRR